jgi:hypothetical protein
MGPDSTIQSAPHGTLNTGEWCSIVTVLLVMSELMIAPETCNATSRANFDFDLVELQ